jgi:hypothetical protein
MSLLGDFANSCSSTMLVNVTIHAIDSKAELGEHRQVPALPRLTKEV